MLAELSVNDGSHANTFDGSSVATEYECTAPIQRFVETRAG